jgi:hypothetical protein
MSSVAAIASSPEFGSDDGDYFNPLLPKMSTGIRVPVIRDQDSWSEGDNVVAAVPVSAFGGVRVARQSPPVEVSSTQAPRPPHPQTAWPARLSSMPVGLPPRLRENVMIRFTISAKERDYIAIAKM